ncbi:amidohydrolase family protein [Cellulosimicrobium funkei]|uniref:Imidazolonepropionase n=1 Tax=Cellulosimicrobium funkei TaxID=264251 RepID=A0A4Y8R7H3_9MICO|nr:amidohydrolase family protein [Cellulosimicrobium funkei]TFF17571.1 imidazolonepropionase [Cellulosimicrobium funkei]TGA74241.1 imidazolonepropionase [Cellulosimicrobium terreum]
MSAGPGSTLVTGIGELTTNAPGGPGTRDGDPTGLVTDAVLLLDGGRVAWAGPAREARDAVGHALDGREPDVTVDAGGRAVLPGFVDSHTHLVFAGDRAAEFEARMAGRPYEAGGIRSTVAATRAASDDVLRAGLARHLDEAARQGTTTVEVKSGYGLTVADEERSVRLAREVTPEVTFLGAHVVPVEHAGRADAYVDLVCGEMLAACAPHARWVDVFCETGAFTPEQSRRVLEAGAAAGLGVRVHANQLGPGEGVRLAVGLGAAAVDHCTYLTDDDVAALAGSWTDSGTRPNGTSRAVAGTVATSGAGAGTVATLLPGVEFSTRQPYPDARRLLDAGAVVALASDCNPGSSYTSSMPLCVALAVREMRMTVAEAVWSATAGGALALRRDDVGHLAPGARADVVLLDAPSRTHLAYRPGVPLVAKTWRSGPPDPHPHPHP